MKYTNITAEELNEFKDHDGHVVLDVGSPQELAEGSIHGYIQLNFFDPDFMVEVEKLDKSKTYLFTAGVATEAGRYVL